MSEVRDVQALTRVEVFLATAIATVLVVRAALAASGYPQVGGGGLHVAHVLYGGLLMGVAIVMVQIVPGSRARMQSAFIGGIGFGLFIDEIGKFLTKNVNYFFRPAVAIIYAIFVIFYVVVREIILRRPLTDQRRLAIAVGAASDLALHQLDSSRRQQAMTMLDGLEPAPLVDAIRACLEIPSDPDQLTRITKGRELLLSKARISVSHPKFLPGLRVLFVLQGLGMIAQLLLVILRPDIGLGAGNHVTDLGTEISTGVSAVLAGVGVWRMQRGNIQGALRILYRSVLVTLFFTQVFVFVRYQWSGLLGFALQAVVLYGLRLALHADVNDVHAEKPAP